MGDNLIEWDEGFIAALSFYRWRSTSPRSNGERLDDALYLHSRRMADGRVFQETYSIQDVLAALDEAMGMGRLKLMAAAP